MPWRDAPVAGDTRGRRRAIPHTGLTATRAPRHDGACPQCVRLPVGTDSGAEGRTTGVQGRPVIGWPPLIRVPARRSEMRIRPLAYAEHMSTQQQDEVITSDLPDLAGVSFSDELRIDDAEYARIMRRIVGDNFGTDTDVSAFNSSI